jgi:hypothetical protein
VSGRSVAPFARIPVPPLLGPGTRGLAHSGTTTGDSEPGAADCPDLLEPIDELWCTSHMRDVITCPGRAFFSILAAYSQFRDLIVL